MAADGLAQELMGEWTMMRSRLWHHLAATFSVGLSGASALAAEQSGATPSGQAVDDETPYVTIPDPSSSEGPPSQAARATAVAAAATTKRVQRAPELLILSG
jgi:hypothetical protein